MGQAAGSLSSTRQQAANKQLPCACCTALRTADWSCRNTTDWDGVERVLCEKGHAPPWPEKGCYVKEGVPPEQQVRAGTWQSGVWEQRAPAPRTLVNGVQRQGCRMQGGGRQPPAPCPPLLPCLCWPPASRAHLRRPGTEPRCCSARRLPKRGRRASSFSWAYGPTLQRRPTSEWAGQGGAEWSEAPACEPRHRLGPAPPASCNQPAAGNGWALMHRPRPTLPNPLPTHQALQDACHDAEAHAVRDARAHRLPQKVWAQLAMRGRPWGRARALLPLPPHLGGAPLPLTMAGARARPSPRLCLLPACVRCQAASCQPADSCQRRAALMVGDAASPPPAGRHL